MARNLRLFFTFRLLATSYLWVPVLWYFMTSRGLGFDQIMVLSAVYSGVVILVEVPTGALADRIGRRRSMMGGALAMVAACILAYFAHSFGQFMGFEILSAISMSLCSGADSAYLFDLLHNSGRADEYPRREGTSSAWHQAGNVVAFAAGGWLGSKNLALPYLATAGVAAVAFLVALFMGGDTRPAQPQPAARVTIRREFRDYFAHMRRSVADVRGSRRLTWIIAYSAVVFVLLRATVYLYQPYLDARGFGVAEVGYIFAAVYLVAALVAHRGDALRRLLGERVLVWIMLGTLAVTFAVLNQFRGQWALLVLAVQAGANGLYSPLVKPMLNREIPDSERRATVLSVESIARRSAMVVFAPIAGYYGAVSANYLCGAVGIVGFALLAMTARHSPAAPRDGVGSGAWAAVPPARDRSGPAVRAATAPGAAAGSARAAD